MPHFHKFTVADKFKGFYCYLLYRRDGAITLVLVLKSALSTFFKCLTDA